MQHRAAGSLWASISEGRPPLDGEIQRIAAKMWDEVFGLGSGLTWNQVEIGSLIHRRSMAAALAALGLPPLRLV